MEAEEGEQSDIFSSLLTLGQLSEDKEPLPSPTASHADTLEARSQAVQETLCNASPAHNDYGAKEFVAKVGEGQENADGEDPFRDVEGDKLSRFDLGRPLVEGQKLVGGEDVDCIDGDRDDERDPEESVGERSAP